MIAPADVLRPEIEVDCAACGDSAVVAICTAAELALQMKSARRFHLERLLRSAPSALEQRASFTQDYATDLFACRSCGLLYRSPRPTAGAVLHAYEHESHSAERLPQMIRSQRALYGPKARALARRLAPGARVLEVGSFVGGFLWAAREAGLVASGLDPSEEMAALCRRNGLDVTCATLEELAASGVVQPHDAIAIWNAFDQIPRSSLLLRAALDVLRPGGLVLLRFPHGPCFRQLAQRTPLPRRELAWNNLLGFPYLLGYGLRSLDALLAPLGLVRISAQGDTLGAVADRTYARWARIEERAVKAIQRARWARDLVHAPRLDVVLRDER